MSEQSGVEVYHKEQGTQHEHVIVKAGTHHVHVREGDGETVEIYVHDHLNVAIHGEHKDEPLVVVSSDEFTTNLAVTDPERSFRRTSQERSSQ